MFTGLGAWVWHSLSLPRPKHAHEGSSLLGLNMAAPLAMYSWEIPLDMFASFGPFLPFRNLGSTEQTIPLVTVIHRISCYPHVLSASPLGFFIVQLL